MRNLLAFFGAAVVVLLGLGYYLNWYTITKQSTSPGQTRLQVDINKDKFEKDFENGVHTAADKVQEVIDKNKQNAPTNSDGKQNATGNGPTNGSTPSSQPAKSDKVREDIGNLIIDGWDSGTKK